MPLPRAANVGDAARLVRVALRRHGVCTRELAAVLRTYYVEYGDAFGEALHAEFGARTAKLVDGPVSFRLACLIVAQCGAGASLRLRQLGLLAYVKSEPFATALLITRNTDGWRWLRDHVGDAACTRLGIRGLVTVSESTSDARALYNALRTLEPKYHALAALLLGCQLHAVPAANDKIRVIERFVREYSGRVLAAPAAYQNTVYSVCTSSAHVGAVLPFDASVAGVVFTWHMVPLLVGSHDPAVMLRRLGEIRASLVERLGRVEYEARTCGDNAVLHPGRVALKANVDAIDALSEVLPKPAGTPLMPPMDFDNNSLHAIVGTGDVDTVVVDEVYTAMRALAAEFRRHVVKHAIHNNARHVPVLYTPLLPYGHAVPRSRAVHAYVDMMRDASFKIRAVDKKTVADIGREFAACVRGAAQRGGIVAV